MAVEVFLDTSVLLAGLIDFGPQSAPAQSLLHGVAEKTITGPATAWHCCLEFYSVATRLPPEFRVSPADAVQLLSEEVFSRMAVEALPPRDCQAMLPLLVDDGIAGGRASMMRTSPRWPAPPGPAYRHRQSPALSRCAAARAARGDAGGVSGVDPAGQEALSKETTTFRLPLSPRSQPKRSSREVNTPPTMSPRRSPSGIARSSPSA